MSFKFPYTPSITNRADIRFNGETLTLSAGNGTGIPAAANGMVVTRLGTVGIGTTNPYGRLHVQANNGYSLYSSNDSGFAIYGISSSGYAGFFEGKAKVTGTLEVGSCAGCTMTSDQNLKTNFSSINPRLVLDHLAAIPIRQWNYKADDSSVHHLGPMAQDFRSAFNLGADDKHIDMIDANGVTMAAIQGLYQMSLEQNKELTNQIKEQSRQIKQLQTRLARVERTAHKNNSHRRRAAR
jgi:Chaperone of endosialidase